MGIGNWALGIGHWALGIGDKLKGGAFCQLPYTQILHQAQKIKKTGF
ncbi:MAG: hypothetical protein F6K41_22385 [Symploca sp. SIO3E6]|nr:hypothetical protein [Caldora sp. SIO3E6]